MALLYLNARLVRANLTTGIVVVEVPDRELSRDEKLMIRKLIPDFEGDFYDLCDKQALLSSSTDPEWVAEDLASDRMVFGDSLGVPVPLSPDKDLVKKMKTKKTPERCGNWTDGGNQCLLPVGHEGACSSTT